MLNLLVTCGRNLESETEIEIRKILNELEQAREQLETSTKNSANLQSDINRLEREKEL